MTPERRTYWHLEKLGRRPTDYEIASTRLLYHPTRGLAVDTPCGEWLDRNGRGGGLTARDWDAFCDPRETTYAKYTAVQAASESLVDGLLEAMETDEYERGLSDDWLALLERALTPMRFAWHGLQMTAAYVGHLAPGSRIVIACAMQAADELRRTQRVAYRIASLRVVRPGFARNDRQNWMQGKELLPVRHLLEQLLKTYGWGEAFVALNLVVKPALDDVVMRRLAVLAAERGDPLLGEMLRVLAADCVWQREWTEALTEMLEEEDSGNEQAMGLWRAGWETRTAEALQALQAAL